MAFVLTAFQRDGLKFEHPVHLYSGIYRLDTMLLNLQARKLLMYLCSLLYFDTPCVFLGALSSFSAALEPA